MQSKDDHDIEAGPYLDDESIVVVGGAVWVLSVQHRLSSHLFSSVRISGALNLRLKCYALTPNSNNTRRLRVAYFRIFKIVTKTTTKSQHFPF